MRKFIPTHWHAIMDYLLVLILLGGPWLSGFDDVPAATKVSMWSAAAIAGLSIFTCNEGGIVRVIPMNIHLILDIFLGVFLILSPFIFGFSAEVYTFHMLMGFIILGSGIFTRTSVKKRRPPVPVGRRT
ncbi:hypothetical protein BC792_10579 [Sphingobacterium allocomposti]|jgi:hypothetical protein|uniref:SPW repeat-containing integral membrane domain-containing protein n=1 Tax=Sphingobacterium allocomposti TaxID=415956 RepID=A0A5S5DMG7_9SPHI|nr:hypothetical protein [Sphingobacterium composti Yoo et al. 2007 non Ten et al. 2007]TYP96588.1 hypothetical protein BC792_10579 [Sphingobacterium composti Yoo et al. 2007 non Ten et al. 2007]HLS96024.1 hypothetical protein [Sphingobacterium sp.]